MANLVKVTRYRNRPLAAALAFPSPLTMRPADLANTIA